MPEGDRAAVEAGVILCEPRPSRLGSGLGLWSGFYVCVVGVNGDASELVGTPWVVHKQLLLQMILLVLWSPKRIIL